MNYLKMTIEEILGSCKMSETDIQKCIEELDIHSPQDLIPFDTVDVWKEIGISNFGVIQRVRHAVKQITRIAEQEDYPQVTPTQLSVAAATPTQVVTVNEMLTKVLGDLGNLDNEAMLSSLRQEGLLQFDRTTYLAAIKVVVATKYGVYDGILRLKDLLLKFAVKNNRPAPPEYYDLNDLMLRRRLGEVLAITNDSRFMYSGIPIYATNQDAEELIRKINTIMIPALTVARDEVTKWYDLFAKQSQADFFIRQNTPIMQQMYPEVDGMLEAGKQLRMAINAALAGDEMPHVIALLHEYRDFLEVLNHPDLPGHVGAVDRDNVLNLLGFDAKAGLLRSEKALLQFTYCMIDVENLSKSDEVSFYQLMFNLVKQIDWSAIVSTAQEDSVIDVTESSETLPGSEGINSELAMAAIASKSLPQAGMTTLDGGTLHLIADR